MVMEAYEIMSIERVPIGYGQYAVYLGGLIYSTTTRGCLNLANWGLDHVLGRVLAQFVYLFSVIVRLGFWDAFRAPADKRARFTTVDKQNK